MREEAVVSNTTVKATVTVYYPASASPFLTALFGNLTLEFKQSVSSGVFVTTLHTFATNNNCSALIAYNPKSLSSPSATQPTSVGGSLAPVVAPTGTTSSVSSSDTTLVPGISDFDLEIGIAAFGAAIFIILISFCLWRRSIYRSQRKQMDRWIMGEVPGLNVISRYSSERAIKKTLDSDDAFAFEVNNRGRMQAQHSGRSQQAYQNSSGKYSVRSVGSYYDPRDASGRQLHNDSFRSYGSGPAPSSYKTRPDPVEDDDEDEDEDNEDEEEEDGEEEEDTDAAGEKLQEAKQEGDAKTDPQPADDATTKEKSVESSAQKTTSDVKKSAKSTDETSIKSDKKSSKKNQSGKSTTPSDQAQFDEFVAGSRREDSSSGRVYFQDPRYGAQYSGSQRQLPPQGYYEDPRLGGMQPAVSLRQVLPQGYYDGLGPQSYGGNSYDAYGNLSDPYYPPARPLADFGYGGGYGQSAGYGDDRMYMNRVPADYTSPRDPYYLQQPGYQPNYSAPRSPVSNPGGDRVLTREQSERRPPQSPLFQPRQL